MGAELLSQAFTSTSGVLAGVSVADFEKATPCASWQVRELINHVVGGPRWYASFAVTGAAPCSLFPISISFSSLKMKLRKSALRKASSPSPEPFGILA